MFLLGIYRCLEFFIKIIYYLQNSCFHGFAPTDSSRTNDLNSLQTHIRCVKVPDILCLMYPSLREGGGGGLAHPHDEFSLTNNQQTSLSEVSGTHTQYLWWLAKYYVSCVPTPLSSPTNTTIEKFWRSWRLIILLHFLRDKYSLINHLSLHLFFCEKIFRENQFLVFFSIKNFLNLQKKVCIFILEKNYWKFSYQNCVI